MSTWDRLEVIENHLNAWRWEHEKHQKRADQALGIVNALEHEIECRKCTHKWKEIERTEKTIKYYCQKCPEIKYVAIGI